MDAEGYRAIMRHQAGAVTVIAAGPKGRRAGLTATAVASLSDDPPSILVCVGQSVGAHDVIAELGAFSVNLLASDQEQVAERFAGRHGISGENRFAGENWPTLTTGAPVLEKALATLDCRLTDQHRFKTHTIFIGNVVDGLFRKEARPLLYFRGDYWDVESR